MQPMTNQINNALVAVKSDIQKVIDSHQTLRVQGKLTVEYTRSLSDTESALRESKAHNTTGPDGIQGWIVKTLPTF